MVDESFYVKFYRITHDIVNSEKLLKLLNVAIEDQLSTENPSSLKIIDDGAETIGRFCFASFHLTGYFGYKVKDGGRSTDDPDVNWWHLKDQLDEVAIEAIHSLISCRTGLVKLSTYTLRRCYELATYGTFYASTFLKLNGKEINPFVMLAGEGLWVKNIGKRVLRSDIDKIRDSMKSEGISTSDARKKLFSNFTMYYLKDLCSGYCEEHRQDTSTHSGLLLSIDSTITKSCIKCSKNALYVYVEKTISLDNMIDIIKTKLDLENYGSEISSLYDELSEFVHPNNPSHQHSPDFEVRHLKTWLDLLKRTLRLSLIFHIHGLKYIGFEEKETFELFEQRKYDLNKITLKEMQKIICNKVGEEFNKHNPYVEYEDDFELPSYMKNDK